MQATRSTISSTLCTKIKQTSTSHEYTITIPTMLLWPIWPYLSETSSHSKMVSNGINLRVSRFSRTPTRRKHTHKQIKYSS